MTETPTRLQQLEHLANIMRDVKEISDHGGGVTERDQKYRHAKPGMIAVSGAEIKCLGCDQLFRSGGKHNRMCANCRGNR